MGRYLLSNKTPNNADMNEPHRMPSLACPRTAAPPWSEAYERSAMKMETVSPMPQSIHTDAKERQSLPCGRETNPHFIAIHEKENTPTNLPTTRPTITGKVNSAGFLLGYSVYLLVKRRKKAKA